MNNGYIQYNKQSGKYESVSWETLFEQRKQKEESDKAEKWKEAEQRIQARLRERDVITGYHIEDPWGWLFNAK